MLVHKATPDSSPSPHCVYCRASLKRVPGGQGPTWVHRDSGAVAAAGADHDYEPGDTTRPMSGDPECRICGEPKRDH